MPSPLSPLHSRSSAGRLPCRLKLLFTEALHLCFYTNHHVLNGMSSPFNATQNHFSLEITLFFRAPTSFAFSLSISRPPSFCICTNTHP